MAADPMEIRMARLEGAYEQIDRRLESLERHIDARFDAQEPRFAGIDAGLSKLDAQMLALFGTVIGTWITTMLAILFHR